MSSIVFYVKVNEELELAKKAEFVVGFMKTQRIPLNELACKLCLAYANQDRVIAVVNILTQSFIWKRNAPLDITMDILNPKLLMHGQSSNCSFDIEFQK